MRDQIPLDESSRADRPPSHEKAHDVRADIAYLRTVLVNVAFLGDAQQGWFLVDAGVAGSGSYIINAAEERFGEGEAPHGIILTHAHFDHVGSLDTLLEEWNVPVYAHLKEFPFLTGKESYPPPNPAAGGGLIATLSRFFPRSPIDISKRLRPVNTDGTVPGLPDWRWIHTPGHSRGHISLWREADRSLLAGDAFISTKQESAYSVMTQALQLHGPPAYFTEDWKAAGNSVRALASLHPEVAITGHGRALEGPEFVRALHILAERFESIAVPENRR